MPQYHVTRRVPYNAADIYNIIADVAAYPEFVPLCRAARVWDERIEPSSLRCFKAELLIVYDKLGLKKNFVSDVTCDPERLVVRALSNRRPVKHIDNKWCVLAISPDSCDIDFSIDYEMSSRILQFALSNAFDYTVRKIITAFEARAKALHDVPV